MLFHHHVRYVNTSAAQKPPECILHRSQDAKHPGKCPGRTENLPLRRMNEFWLVSG